VANTIGDGLRDALDPRHFRVENESCGADCV
jgi:hypothetical protein